MTVKQVLYNVALFLGKEDLLECSYFTNESSEISVEEQKELDVLLRCLNFILSEISTDYLPIYKQKEVEFVDNQYSLVDLDTNIYKIVSIKDKFDKKVKFKIYDNKIIANVNNCIITYSAYAEKCFLDGNVENFNNLLSDRVLAYGTAMEYSFLNNLYDDATIWESRYKNSLFVISQKKHNIVMPKRRWI